jgi:hypothetical protein
MTEETSEPEPLAEWLLHRRLWRVAFREVTTDELDALAARHSSLTSTRGSWSPLSC